LAEFEQHVMAADAPAVVLIAQFSKPISGTRTDQSRAFCQRPVSEI
jgi:hypothetical protein